MAVVAVGRGDTCHGAARALACAPSTVSVAVRRYREEGCQGLTDRRASNGEAKMDECFLAALARVLKGTPEDWDWCRPTWTRELLVLELERRGRQRVSVATLGRALARLGAGLKAAKPSVGCPWPGWKRRRRLYELRCLEARAPARGEVVLFVDEVDIHLNPKVGRDWCLPGQRRVVLTPGNIPRWAVTGACRGSAGWC